MNPTNPEVQAVAVRDGRIICAGTLEACQSWGESTVDDRFADHVLIPGFVEAHGHTMDRASELAPYVGYYPYPLSDGTSNAASDSYEDLIARLKEEDVKLSGRRAVGGQRFRSHLFPGPAAAVQAGTGSGVDHWTGVRPARQRTSGDGEHRTARRRRHHQGQPDTRCQTGSRRRTHRRTPGSAGDDAGQGRLPEDVRRRPRAEADPDSCRDVPQRGRDDIH